VFGSFFGWERRRVDALGGFCVGRQEKGDVVFEGAGAGVLSPDLVSVLFEFLRKIVKDED